MEKLTTNIKRDTFRHFAPYTIAISQSIVGAGFKPAPTLIELGAALLEPRKQIRSNNFRINMLSEECS
ncbi:MAG: hypothetical protein U9R02_01895 [Thermodesulfobacteriota bacterium]|nr:hypothetical protein [Thermodesulfobacteriota bacterium]